MKFSINWSFEKILETMARKKARFWHDPAGWVRANNRIDGFCQARDMRCFAEVGKRANQVLTERENRNSGQSKHAENIT